MATGNKTTTAKKTSSKSNSKNTVTDKKRTGTKSQNKRPSAKAGQARNTEKQKPKFSFEDNRQKTAIILGGIAVLFLAAILIKGEHIWLGIHNFIFGLFGITSFVWPIVLIYLTVIIASNRSMVSARSNIIGASIFMLILSGVVHLFSNAAAFESLADQFSAVWSLRDQITFGSGGVIGVIFGGIPKLLFGKLAAAIVLIVILIVVFMFMTGTTLLGVYILIKGFIDKFKTKKVYNDGDEESFDEPQPRKRKPFTPVSLGPEFEKTEEDMFIEELVGNETKKDPPVNKKRPKPFIDVTTGEVVAEPPVSIEDIIKKANTETESTAEKKTTESRKEPVKLKVAKEEKAEDTSPAFKVYQKPTSDCLEPIKDIGAGNYEEELKTNAKKLVETLNSFGVATKIVDICRGPSVTRYELQPAPGVKISKITGLADDITMALASTGVRIEAPIPNKAAVGIEVPNKTKSIVSFREIVETSIFSNARSKLNVALGKDITGNVICADIAKMPHLLIAGTTGSGKSVCLNSMIVSILFNATPDEVKLVMIDPKQVEFTVYNGIPHLLVPVVSDPRKAAGALGWAVTEMLQRYKMFSEKSVRDIKGYNRLAETDNTITPLPHIVIFIDELSDLMMAAPNEVEDSICRLAQMARAAGMHLVIATQRPSVNVITGVIKANIPSRIALSVSSQVDSRTIIDTAGAEKLLGNGDMLFNPVGTSKPVRVQGCYLSDEEVESVVTFIKTQNEDKKYDESVMQEIERQATMEASKKSASAASAGDDESSGDEMLPKAIEVVVEAQMASTTLLQRKLKLGYARAARIVDELEQRGIVGPFEGAKPRKVLISKQQWMEMNALGNSSAPIENPIETEDEE
jgi:S-DNA-T family DNA segregation ATPase FtsK/SpoIIIE